MELNKVLDKIRGLITKAESLEELADEHSLLEALACRTKADEMMQKYAVEEWQTMRAAPIQTKPERIKIDIGEEDNMFLTEMATLVNVVAQFCKCSSVWMNGSAYKAGNKQEYCWVYGYESDLRYFEMLFTTLFLHMGGAIFPKPDPAKTLGVNAYELHNAGLNWFDIAKAYGWYKVPSRPGEAENMYVNQNTGERLSWSKSIGKIKNAYTKEIQHRGEQPLRIPPSGSETFRRNAAQGYLARIGQRLREVAGARGSGAELVLADKSDNINELIHEYHPSMAVARTKSVRYNETAYRKGVSHANTASLNPSTTRGSRPAVS
jgi:hypothetical protein